jgi:hypothetical protein
VGRRIVDDLLEVGCCLDTDDGSGVARKGLRATCMLSAWGFFESGRDAYIRGTPTSNFLSHTGGKWELASVIKHPKSICTNKVSTLLARRALGDPGVARLEGCSRERDGGFVMNESAEDGSLRLPSSMEED